MKYYYKIFIHEGVKESLQYIKAPESFIKKLEESSSFNGELEDHMKEFYVSYDIDQVRKGKPDEAWKWSSERDYFKVNHTFKGEVHPERSAKINKLKKLWENEN